MSNRSVLLAKMRSYYDGMMPRQNMSREEMDEAELAVQAGDINRFVIRHEGEPLICYKAPPIK